MIHRFLQEDLKNDADKPKSSIMIPGELICTQLPAIKINSYFKLFQIILITSHFK